jgi:hypothetical protein
MTENAGGGNAANANNASGGAGNAGATAGSGAGNSGAGGTAAGLWYEGLAGFDAETIAHAKNKGWLPTNVADLPGAYVKAVFSHRGAEKLIGVPQDKLLRIPEASAGAAEWDSVFQRLGVPKEAKEYDFTGIKYKDGTEPEPGFLDKMRGAFAAAHVTKEGAAAVTKAVIGYLEDADATESAVLAGQVAEQKAWLDKNWPAAVREGNLFVANQALGKLAAAAGLTADQAKSAWDALSKVGGIGAGYAMEMLRTIGMRMGEGKLIDLGSGSQGGPMTVEQARDEIAMLKNDKAFRDKLLAGGKEETLRWRALHKIIAGSMAA